MAQLLTTFFHIEINKIFEEFINGITQWLDEKDNLPAYIQNIGLALLGILIPLAVAILIEFYRKKREPEEEFSELDLHVILDHVFKLKHLILYTLMIFFPYLFWKISNESLRLFELIISVAGICCILKIIYNVYSWIKGNVFGYRFSYLKNVKNPTDLEVVWRSVWETKNINPQNEREFFKIFSTTIDSTLEDMKRTPAKIIKEFLRPSRKKSLIVVAKMLSDFYSFLKLRSIIFLVVFEEVFPKILNWKFIAWKKEFEYLSQEGKNEDSVIWMIWAEISRHLNQIIVGIEERALEERQALLFFKHLKEHVTKYEAQYILVQGHKRYYVENLLRVCYQVFFDKVSSSPERFSIWDHCFPADWKVTRENIEKKENIASRVTLKMFLDWARMRIMDTRKDYDLQLDEVSCNLFPELHSETWAVILTFVFSPYGESRVKSVIERPWTFGLLKRTSRVFHTASREYIEQELQQQEEAEIKNTYELTVLLFSDVFSKEYLEKYIEEAKSLKYPTNSLEERKRLKLLKILQGMYDFVENSEKTKTYP